MKWKEEGSLKDLFYAYDVGAKFHALQKVK